MASHEHGPPPARACRTAARHHGATADGAAAVTAFDGASYQARFDELAIRGIDVHGEAAFVRTFEPRTVLDAGCGTGRVAIELAGRGVSVVGVDVDPSMLDEARRRSTAVTWLLADLSDLQLDREFDAVVLAGNVPIFCPAPARPALVRACAAHVAAGGVLVAGFGLTSGYTLSEWDAGCEEAGLEPVERWATWDREPLGANPAYAVSVHRRERGPHCGPRT